ncbi:MAG: hypothetical protein AMJ62_07980 [Myxococcales bacterium SG8_38]|nr:MAG: hypothetical protein AMJ62_07980 [Myxococcales bacterium SG8_38]
MGCDSTSASEPTTTLGDTVGVNTHYGARGPVDEQALTKLADAGVRFIRNDLDWAEIEKEPGVYDFAGTGFDDLVETAEDLGLRILFILDYGNPLYGEIGAVVDDDGRQAFAAFAAAAARRYGGRGHSWEIWNEPNLEQFWSSSEGGPDPDLYAELVRSTAPALRAEDPDGDIVVGALYYGFPELIEATELGIGGPRFLQAVAATGALALADEVTLHLYRPANPEDVISDVEGARALLKSAGYPLPISSGEWGYSTYDPNAPSDGFNFLPAVTLSRQASYLARMLLYNYSLGLRRSVIFKDRDEDNPSPGNIEHHWGLMTGDLVPKPSLVAISTLSELVGNASLVETLVLGSGEHGLRFERDDGSEVIALWSEQQATWAIRSESQDAQVLGRDGSDLTPATLPDGAELTVESDDGPIYLIGSVTVSSGRSP